MTREIALVGSLCTGHEDWPPRRAITGSSTVFINGLGVHCVGDLWEVHCHKNNKDCHDSFLSEGSGTIFVEGKSVGRVGDLIACGSFVATGSPNVGG